MKETLTFDAVYARHIPYVRRVLQQLGVRSGDLDDVVQDTFVAVHRQLPAFEGRAALETWLHAICWRVAAGYHRRARTRRKVAGATELHSDDSLGEQSVLPAVDRLLALLETLFALMRRTAEVSPQGILHLSCNEPTSGPPDGPARDAIRRFTADIDNGMKAAAFTTRSQGWFRILPPIINTCLFLSGKRYKTRFCNEERPVFEWLAQYTTVTADEMQDACDDLRRLIDEAELAAESVRAKEQPWATA